VWQLGHTRSLSVQVPHTLVTCGSTLPSIAIGHAKRAVAAHPEKSNRAIAKETGVSHTTVQKARATGNKLPVEKRVGRDGKARRNAAAQRERCATMGQAGSGPGMGRPAGDHRQRRAAALLHIDPGRAMRYC
jgi:hypothetical protein